MDLDAATKNAMANKVTKSLVPIFFADHTQTAARGQSTKRRGR